MNPVGKLAPSVLLLFAAGLPLAWGADKVPTSQAPPLESVTVTATKASEAAIETFISSHATPTRVADKLARWKAGICPLTTGLAPKFAAYITQRVRDVAANVGAPLNTDTACKPNIRIVFTTAPQVLLNNLRKTSPGYFGYYDSQDELTRLTTFNHPIQSWYTTATRDLRGYAETDNHRSGGTELLVQDPTVPATFATIIMPSAHGRNITGTRLGDGLSSEFTNVLIVAEPGKLLDYEMGTLADYIAVLALSQCGPPDDCGDLPSIANLLAPGCPRTINSVADGDLAYLRGLYSMTAGGSLQVQRREIRYEMEQALKPKS